MKDESKEESIDSIDLAMHLRCCGVNLRSCLGMCGSLEWASRLIDCGPGSNRPFRLVENMSHHHSYFQQVWMDDSKLAFENNPVCSKHIGNGRQYLREHAAVLRLPPSRNSSAVDSTSAFGHENSASIRRAVWIFLGNRPNPAKFALSLWFSICKYYIGIENHSERDH